MKLNAPKAPRDGAQWKRESNGDIGKDRNAFANSGNLLMLQKRSVI
jgi:hypothetical protein